MKFFTKVFLLIALLILPLAVSAQYQAPDNTSKPAWLAVKTNLFYGAYTLTPNLSLELGLGQRSSLEIGGGYNPWNYNGTKKTDASGVEYIDNKKLVHWLGALEYRYWLCQRFSGHFFGVHALASQFNISEYDVPWLLEFEKQYRYQGRIFGDLDNGWLGAVGGGVSYGYQFLLGKHWNVETTIGVGYVYLKYDVYQCPKCGDHIPPTRARDYVGPTKIGISLMYIF